MTKQSKPPGGPKPPGGLPVRFQINPRIPGGISRSVPGVGTYLRGFTYEADGQTWAKLRKHKEGRKQIFIKSK